MVPGVVVCVCRGAWQGLDVLHARLEAVRLENATAAGLPVLPAVPVAAPAAVDPAAPAPASPAAPAPAAAPAPTDVVV
jgi:hypothetical protein